MTPRPCAQAVCAPDPSECIGASQARVPAGCLEQGAGCGLRQCAGLRSSRFRKRRFLSLGLRDLLGNDVRLHRSLLFVLRVGTLCEAMQAEKWGPGRSVAEAMGDFNSKFHSLRLPFYCPLPYCPSRRWLSVIVPSLPSHVVLLHGPRGERELAFSDGPRTPASDPLHGEGPRWGSARLSPSPCFLPQCHGRLSPSAGTLSCSVIWLNSALRDLLRVHLSSECSPSRAEHLFSLHAGFHPVASRRPRTVSVLLWLIASV